MQIYSFYFSHLQNCFIMNITTKFMIAAALFFLSASGNFAFSQAKPILYFCQSYSSNGEVGVSDRFTKGYITVMVKSDVAMGLKNVSIQYDRYDPANGSFKFYKKFNFAIYPQDKYVAFSKTPENDMSFDLPGIYRVYLLDSQGKNITSGLVEIIP